MTQIIRRGDGFIVGEVKTEGERGVFSGYASTYARDLQGDRVTPGAFAKSINEKKGKLPILMGHDFGIWSGVTTSLAEDHKGLLMEAVLFLDTAAGRDAYGLLKNAKQADFTTGLSIGFFAKDTDWDDGSQTRLIKEIDLLEISITPFPANRQARIDDVKTMRNLERMVRDVTKCSQDAAKRLLSVLPLELSAEADGEQPTSDRDGQTTGRLTPAVLRSALKGFKLNA